MAKERGYQEIMQLATPWFEEVIETVKRDLKQEHLKIDAPFCRRYFLGKGIATISSQEMAKAYEKDIAEGNVGLAEFIASRWVMKNSEIYNFFDQKLISLTSDYEKLQEIDEVQAEEMMKESTLQFGPVRTYLFALFNSVVISDTLLEKLRKEAQEAQKRAQENEAQKGAEVQQKRDVREAAALQDRYEKKLAGLQKKYLHDMDSLKKQIRMLQKKLDDKS